MSITNSVRQYFSGVWEESKKVIWPSRKEVINNTLTIIISVVIMAALFGLLDYIFSKGLQVLISLQR